MVRGVQGMEPEDMPTKVQVVYYLSRGDQLQQPHLIDIQVSAHSNGLYLSDVKKKLTSIRGKGVADSFSWSCKRNYKENYIWQDLADDDRIFPLSDGEFVLKGSGFFAQERTTGENDIPGGSIEPDSTSVTLQHQTKSSRIERKKFDFEAVKRSLDLQADHLQDQSNPAAPLSLSLQLMNNPHAHTKSFSKDRSMDLNEQVMNSLSQARTDPAEELCILDHYDMSSRSETLISEDSTAHYSLREKSRELSKSMSSASSRTGRKYPASAKQATSNLLPYSRDGSRLRKEVVKNRQESSDLPSIDTKNPPAPGEHSDTTGFTLSPRRIMQALSTSEKTFAKMLHSSSVRLSTLSNSSSMHNEGPLSAMKLSRQATCLSQLRLCSQLSQHATDSRPESPVRQSPHTLQFSSTVMALSPTSRGQRSPYWGRWKAGRKVQSSDHKIVSNSTVPKELDSVPIQEQEPALVRRTLKAAFEQHIPDIFSSGSAISGTPLLLDSETPTTSNASSYSPVTPGAGETRRLLSGVGTGAESSRVTIVPSTIMRSTVVGMNPVSVKEVMTEHWPLLDLSTEVGEQKSVMDFSDKDSFSQHLPIQSILDCIDTASLPRISISDAISDARETVRSARSPSPESPLKQNPPCSPVRINHLSTVRASSPARKLSIPASVNKRLDDDRPRARGLVKEVASKDFRFIKDLSKEFERSKINSASTMRSKQTNISRTSTTSASVGAKSISINRSPLQVRKINFVDRDERPLTAGRSHLDWEKLLQEAASASLPPPDFGQILQECG